MSRKCIGGGMMVSLALLAGCSQTPKTVDVSGIFPTREDASRRTSPDAAKPPERQMIPTNPVAQDAPVAALPPEAHWLPSVPEVVGVRVADERTSEGLPPPGLIPAQVPAETRPATPAVDSVRTDAGNVAAVPTPAIILTGVGEEPVQGPSQPSLVTPVPAQPTAETPRIVVNTPAPETVSPSEAPRIAVNTPAPETASPPVPEVSSEPGVTSAPGYGHAADYGWLEGELQYLRARNVWRLRYAPADQEDRHGGAVLLVGDGVPADHVSGEIVRVEGQLLNPDSDEARPTFWVRTVRTVKAAPFTRE